MSRVPLLSGSRIVVVPVDEETAVLRPPPPPAHVLDTRAAVRDAIRFPLSGPALRDLLTPGGRVTVLVEPPALPFPGALVDPRQDALAATLDELEQAGVPGERQTILVAGGLGRRLAQRDLERLLPAPRARSFRGSVVVHDAEDPALVPLVRDVRAHPALLDADAVVAVTAAETVVHGGPAALAGACDARSVRRLAAAESLLQAGGAPEWVAALEVEGALAARVPLLGISLVLDHPRLAGRFRGYPHEERSLEHVVTSPLRRVYSLLPGGVRRRLLSDQGRRLTTLAAYAGPPAVAHAEALVRTTELRAIRVAEPFDALVCGVPWTGPHVPREPLNPVTSAAVTLGLALRLWRESFPVRPDGTLVLVHTLTRSFVHGALDPYRTVFGALASGDPEALERSENRSAQDERAIAAYRSGRTCHPLLAFADWHGCRPALARLGRVIVAGSRDSAAARALGFVPSHSLASALEMAHGVAGGHARVAVLLAPPYAPLLVGE